MAQGYTDPALRGADDALRQEVAVLSRIVAFGRVVKDRGDELLGELVAVVREKLVPALREVAAAVWRIIAHRWGLLTRWRR